MVSTLDESEHIYAVRMMKTGLMAQIATHIALRKLTHPQAAELLELDLCYISYIVNGKHERLSIDHLVRICRKLGYGIELQFYTIDPKGA